MSAASFLRSESVQFGIGELEIAQRALLPMEMGRDETPRQARQARGGLDRQRAGGGRKHAEAGVFQPVAKGR